MRGRLPGTKVHELDQRSSATSVAERPEGRARRPSAAKRSEPRRGDPRKASPPGTKNARGPVGRPAPQRRSALHGDTGRVKVPRRLRRAHVRTGVQRPEPEVERSGTRARVRTGNGFGNGTGTGHGVAQVTYIHIFHNPHTSVLPPLTRSGGKDASVWARVPARAFVRFRGRMQAQNGDLVHGIGVLKLDIHHTRIWE